MPWVSKATLIRTLQEKYLSQGCTQTKLLDMLHKDVQATQKRIKQCCQQQECDCVLFGLYDDYPPEYEYYVDDIQ